MASKWSPVLFVMLLLFPHQVDGGPFSYVACMATVAAAGVVAGSAVLPALGFTSSGIAAGSWAASWMATYAGAVPAGSLFAMLQSAGATGAFSLSSFGGLSGFCAALTAPFP